MYVDEFQNFATEAFANILSEARKYRLRLILGHQYIGQLTTDNSTKMRDAVFGNVGTLVVFRVGAEDAEFLEKEFLPEFTAENLVNLAKYNIYLKLMIDGISSHPFSCETLPPPAPLEESNRDKIIKASREKYGVKVEIVEEKITRWTGLNEEKTETSAGDKSGSKKTVMPKAGPARSFTATDLRSQENSQVLYDAICSNCGKNTKVVFQPEPGRPVYCKSCRKKMKSAGKKVEGVQPIALASLPANDNIKIENVSFKADRQKQGQENHNLIQPVAYKDGSLPKRKEINLSELRKALEKSMENKEKEDSLANDFTADNDQAVAQTNEEINEGESVGEEILDNKEGADEGVKDIKLLEAPVSTEKLLPAQKNDRTDDQHKKGVINPGQKINL